MRPCGEVKNHESKIYSFYILDTPKLDGMVVVQLIKDIYYTKWGLKI